MEIKIRRQGGNPIDRHGRMQRFRYEYSWQTPSDISWPNADGTTRPGPRGGSYVRHGTSRVELESMLKRKFGRDVSIVRTWEA